MQIKDDNLAGWILTVVALFVLASNGNFDMIPVLAPVSFLLACVMIGPCDKAASNGKSRKAVG